MRVTVEMTEEELRDYIQYRKDRTAAQTDYNQLRRKAYQLREAVFDAIDWNEKRKTAEITGYEEAAKLVRLAYDL